MPSAMAPGLEALEKPIWGLFVRCANRASSPRVIRRNRRHVDDVAVLGVERDDLDRLVQADEQRADDGGAAEFL